MGALTNPSYYRALTRKMTVTVIIVPIAPMVLVIGIILGQFHVSYKEKVRAHLGEIVLKHKQNIDGFLNEKLSDIRFLAQTASLRDLKDAGRLQEKLLQLQREYGRVFEDLGLINQHGRQVAYAGPFMLENAMYSESVWFKRAVGSDFFISDVFLGLRGLPHFIVAVRINREGDPYILRATIDFVAFNNLVENLRIGRTGFAFILNRHGILQTKPHPELMDVKPDEETYAYFLKNGRAARNGIHVAEREDAAGRQHIYVAAFLKNDEWLMVYRQDTADAYTDLRRTQTIAVLIFITGGLGIVTMAILLTRRMVSRIATSDREKNLMNRQVIEAGKLASIGELAAGIAHEINNPVAIMVEEAGWIQDLLAEEDFKDTENMSEFRRALNQIHTQGKRCKEITHKLLSFARKTDPRVQQVQINELIEEVVGISSQRAKYGSIAIHTDLEKNLPCVEMSPTEFQQVFLNLVNNALDAMEKKGGRLDVRTRLDGSQIITTVADTGPGIPRDNLARIFDPFFTTKPVGKGTGLGLSICYGIVKKLGGEIEVQSEMGAGAVFTVRLPVSRETINKRS